jgi:hypothetical protein
MDNLLTFIETIKIMDNNIQQLKGDYGYHTILIDFTYNTIEVFDTIGLDATRDLGEEFEEWLNEDLFAYMEMEGHRIYDLVKEGSLVII